MKKSFLLCASVLLLCTLLSCNLGLESELNPTPEGKSLVKVSFQQVQTKSLATDYGNMELTYLLTAEPHFTREKGVVVGSTVVNQVLVPDGSGKLVAGYFEEGHWEFTLNAVLSDGESNSKTIATKNLPDVYITPANSTVRFSLTDVDEGDTGSISVSVKVPILSAPDKSGSYGVSLNVFVDDAEIAEDTITNATPDTESTSEELLLISGTVTGIDVGFHNIRLEYSVNSETICSQNIAVRVVDGAVANITGTMLNGAYASGIIEVSYSTNEWGLSIEADPESAAVKPNSTIVLTCDVTGSITGETYQWYIDGEKAGGSDKQATYSFSSDTQGIFSVSCVVTCDDVIKSASTYVEVSDLVEEDE